VLEIQTESMKFLKEVNRRRTMRIIEKIEKLCKKYNLDDNIKTEITKLSKESYSKGSNDCHEAYNKHVSNISEKYIMAEITFIDTNHKEHKLIFQADPEPLEAADLLKRVARVLEQQNKKVRF